jgi:uncharacterized protein DUF1064
VPNFGRVGKHHVSKPADRTYMGVVYHSKAEMLHARGLDMQKLAADPGSRVTEWFRQVRFPLVVNGERIATYVADFKVHFANGRVELQEVKGLVTGVSRIKSKLFRALYPDTTLRIFRVERWGKQQPL